MAYTSKANLESMFTASLVRSIVDEDGSGVVNSDEAAIITAAIARADARIDAMLNGVYSVPFSTVPDMIEQISTQMAFAWLCLRSPAHLGLAQAVEAAAMKDLDRLREGTMRLSGQGAEDAAYSTDEGEGEFTRTKYDSDGNEVNDVSGSMDIW